MEKGKWKFCIIMKIIFNSSAPWNLVGYHKDIRSNSWELLRQNKWDFNSSLDSIFLLLEFGVCVCVCVCVNPTKLIIVNYINFKDICIYMQIILSSNTSVSSCIDWAIMVGYIDLTRKLMYYN
jgi:hypothetical protein